MISPPLKQGSKGKLVVNLQSYLNWKAKLPKPIPGDGVFGPATVEAVRLFQKRANLPVDGMVGPQTAAALAKLVGPSATSFAKAFGPSSGTEEESSNSREPVYTLTVNGKQYVFTKKEFEEFNKQMLSELRRTAVLGAHHRTVGARTLWDHFDHLNKDQYVVSWFVSLAGPALPDEGVVKAAEQAYTRLKTAVDSGNFNNVIKELSGASAPINKAYDTMMGSKKAVIGRAEGWVAGLEFVRDNSFKLFEAIATAQMGGTPGAGAIAGGGAGLLKSAAGELGKYLVGTSDGGGAAARNILTDTITGSLNGGVSGVMDKYGGRIIKAAVKSGVSKLPGTWLKRIGQDRLEKFLKNRIEGAGKATFEAAITGAAKLIKHETTPEQFGQEVWKALGVGTLFGGLDDAISNKFGQTVYFKMNSGLRAKFFGKLDPKASIKVLESVISGKGSDGVKKALESAFEKADGSENAERICEKAAAEFANSGVKTLEAEIAKYINNAV
jgi:hypothetical protein